MGCLETKESPRNPRRFLGGARRASENDPANHRVNDPLIRRSGDADRSAAALAEVEAEAWPERTVAPGIRIARRAARLTIAEPEGVRGERPSRFALRSAVDEARRGAAWCPDPVSPGARNWGETRCPARAPPRRARALVGFRVPAARPLPICRNGLRPFGRAPEIKTGQTAPHADDKRPYGASHPLSTVGVHRGRSHHRSGLQLMCRRTDLAKSVLRGGDGAKESGLSRARGRSGMSREGKGM